jgi:hypothetical protein
MLVVGPGSPGDAALRIEGFDLWDLRGVQTVVAQGHRTFGAAYGRVVEWEQPSVNFFYGGRCNRVQCGAFQAGNGFRVEGGV